MILSWRQRCEIFLPGAGRLRKLIVLANALLSPIALGSQNRLINTDTLAGAEHVRDHADQHVKLERFADKRVFAVDTRANLRLEHRAHEDQGNQA
jgi:hypothetical protein